MDKKMLAVAISGALAAPMAAQAIDFKVSGHVNRMIRFADDGKGSDIQHIDNTASRSRFRFVGSGDLGNGLKVGVNYEIGMASNRSGAIPLKAADTGDSFSGTGNDIRHNALWFSGNFGKVTMGHTSGASDGIAFADNSGTALVDEAAVYEHCSSCLIRTTAGGSAGSLASFFSSFDGGRLDVLRYDSPALGPVTIAASVANDNEWEAAAFIDHNMAGGTLSVYGGYRSADNRFGGNQWAVSASFLFSQGTSITGTYGEGDPVGTTTRDPTNYYVKLGHQWGNNAVSVSYGESSDIAGLDVDGTSIGVGWVHTLKKPGVELYAGYHNFDADIPGVKTEDLDVFVIGSRVKFQ